MNKIANYEEACKITGVDPNKEASAQDRLETMIKAINNNEKAVWHNPNKRNYFPWFDVVKDEKKPSGFGLSCIVYDVTCSLTFVGARLTFRELEGLKHMVENHIEFYEAVYLIE